jgi:hypothetical protein
MTGLAVPRPRRGFSLSTAILAPAGATWDPKTCGKVVRELGEAGLLASTTDRNKGGS